MDYKKIATAQNQGLDYQILKMMQDLNPKGFTQNKSSGQDSHQERI
jgi:hypothetical protein